MAAKPNPEFGGERLAACCSYGFRHRFIEDRAHHASMDDPAKAFPRRVRRPGGGHFSTGVSLKPDP